MDGFIPIHLAAKKEKNVGLKEKKRTEKMKKWILGNEPHNAARVQQRGPVSPSGPNPCGKTPVGGPPCKHPPASPARAHATAPVVKATMHK
uniref:Uncharacterized protein n=1 Tax=Vitis vinifera TaxID=29760 RepID=A5B1N5_VITVI|nr:hypothetical protein VITISV_006097 [Vitis vinifera]